MYTHEWGSTTQHAAMTQTPPSTISLLPPATATQSACEVYSQKALVSERYRWRARSSRQAGAPGLLCVCKSKKKKWQEGAVEDSQSVTWSNTFPVWPNYRRSLTVKITLFLLWLACHCLLTWPTTTNHHLYAYTPPSSSLLTWNVSVLFSSSIAALQSSNIPSSSPYVLNRDSQWARNPSWDNCCANVDCKRCSFKWRIKQVTRPDT